MGTNLHVPRAHAGLGPSTSGSCQARCEAQMGGVLAQFNPFYTSILAHGSYQLNEVEVIQVCLLFS